MWKVNPSCSPPFLSYFIKKSIMCSEDFPNITVNNGSPKFVVCSKWQINSPLSFFNFIVNVISCGTLLKHGTFFLAYFRVSYMNEGECRMVSYGGLKNGSMVGCRIKKFKNRKAL